MELNKIYHGDCLELMPQIASGSIDMILCDLPYGKTKCDWDSKIDLSKLWMEYERIIKRNGAIILTATMPFASTLIESNKKLFKYDLVWDKVMTSSPSLAKRQPLRSHEWILVFYMKQPTYNPQLRNIEDVKKPFGKKNGQGSDVIGYAGGEECKRGVGYPKSIIREPRQNNLSGGGLHPSQKPIKLFDWLIKTYTNEGDLILDNCMGSGTTCLSAKRNNRNFIGMEKEQKYFDVSNKRIYG